MVDIITDEEQFKALESIWRQIEQSSQIRIFQTFDWVWNGWNEFQKKEQGSKLWILKWYQNGKNDVVILPTYIDGSRTLRYILDIHSDTFDAIYREGHNHHQAYKEMVEEILKNKDIKSVWLQKMFGDGEALNQFGVQIRGAMVYKDHAFSWLDIKQSEDVIGTFEHMRSKDKADLRAIGRKSAKYELKVLSIDNGDVFPIDAVLNLKNSMLRNTDRKDYFFPETLIKFVQKVYDANKTDIVELWEGGELVALNFMLKKDNRYLSWIFLYTDPRTSTSMYVKYMAQVAKEKGFVLDFGVGVYTYKIGTFRPNTAITYSIRYGKSWWHHISAIKGMLWRVAKDYLKYTFGVGHR